MADIMLRHQCMHMPLRNYLSTRLIGPIVQRLRGHSVTMVTGTDEHGEKIALSAADAGLEPKAHCDAIVAEYKQLWQLVRFSCRVVAVSLQL